MNSSDTGSLLLNVVSKTLLPHGFVCVDSDGNIWVWARRVNDVYQFLTAQIVDQNRCYITYEATDLSGVGIQRDLGPRPNGSGAFWSLMGPRPNGSGPFWSLKGLDPSNTSLMLTTWLSEFVIPWFHAINNSITLETCMSNKRTVSKRIHRQDEFGSYKELKPVDVEIQAYRWWSDEEVREFVTSELEDTFFNWGFERFPDVSCFAWFRKRNDIYDHLRLCTFTDNVHFNFEMRGWINDLSFFGNEELKPDDSISLIGAELTQLNEDGLEIVLKLSLFKSDPEPCVSFLLESIAKYLHERENIVTKEAFFNSIPSNPATRAIMGRLGILHKLRN